MESNTPFPDTSHDGKDAQHPGRPLACPESSRTLTTFPDRRGLGACDE